MALSILKGLVTNYGKLDYQLWHRPLKMASLVYEKEIGSVERARCLARQTSNILRYLTPNNSENAVNY